MIKFHYFTWRVDFMVYQGLPVGGSGREHVRCCHVYSDVSAVELVNWAEDNWVAVGWLRCELGCLPHFDLWGGWLALCGKGVRRKVFVEDLRNVLD